MVVAYEIFRSTHPQWFGTLELLSSGWCLTDPYRSTPVHGRVPDLMGRLAGLLGGDVRHSFEWRPQLPPDLEAVYDNARRAESSWLLVPDINQTYHFLPGTCTWNRTQEINVACSAKPAYSNWFIAGMKTAHGTSCVSITRAMEARAYADDLIVCRTSMSSVTIIYSRQTQYFKVVDLDVNVTLKLDRANIWVIDITDLESETGLPRPLSNIIRSYASMYVLTWAQFRDLLGRAMNTRVGANGRHCLGASIIYRGRWLPFKFETAEENHRNHTLELRVCSAV